MVFTKCCSKGVDIGIILVCRTFDTYKVSHCDVAWAPERLKSPAIRLFLQWFVWASIKQNIKAVDYWPPVKGNIPITGGSPHKGTTWKTSLCHYAIIGEQIRNRHHDDVIKWNHVLCYWPFVGGIHRASVSSPHKGQWRGALMISLICAWTNGYENNQDTGDLRRHRAHYGVTEMTILTLSSMNISILHFMSATSSADVIDSFRVKCDLQAFPEIFCCYLSVKILTSGWHLEIL